jgi:hypothetical protein
MATIQRWGVCSEQQATASIAGPRVWIPPSTQAKAIDYIEGSFNYSRLAGSPTTQETDAWTYLFVIANVAVDFERLDAAAGRPGAFGNGRLLFARAFQYNSPVSESFATPLIVYPGESVLAYVEQVVDAGGTTVPADVWCTMWGREYDMNADPFVNRVAPRP